MPFFTAKIPTFCKFILKKKKKKKSIYPKNSVIFQTGVAVCTAAGFTYLYTQRRGPAQGQRIKVRVQMIDRGKQNCSLL